MKKQIILLLGGNKLNFGILNKFQNAGYYVYVVDWNEKPQMEGDKHYRIDVKDADAIMKALKEDGEWEQVVFAYSSIDLAVTAVAKINRAIGLKTITDEGLKYSSSKNMMTKRWNENGLLNRYSESFAGFSDEIVKMNTEKKLIIKPDNSASSRGITILAKNSNEGDIEKAFYKAKEEATNHLVVVEEFVEGIEFTVDMIGDAYGNVCVYGISRKSHTEWTRNNKIAVKLHYNAVEDALQEKIAEYGIACYKALGFSASLGHLEVLVKEDGVISPVEIGARSSGFIASDLIDIVSGTNYLGELMEVQNGKRLENGLHQQSDKSSVYFFYDFPDGFVIKNECSILDFCDDEILSRYSDREKIKVGNKFANIDNDNARVGFEILEGPKSILTIDYLKDVENKMTLYMSEGNYDL